MHYRLPALVTAVSIDGREFRADEAGIITVAALNDRIRAGLSELGCVAVPEPASDGSSSPAENTTGSAAAAGSDPSPATSESSGDVGLPSRRAPIALIPKPDRFDSPTLEKSFLITALEQAGVDVGDKRRGLDVFRRLYDETARRLAEQAAPA
jgi:hypothetical protein